MRRRLRGTIPARLEFIARWSSSEAVALSLEIEALQQRVPQRLWREDVREAFEGLPQRPARAVLRVPLKSLADAYRRHMVVGLALGDLFNALIAHAVGGWPSVRKRSAPRRMES